MSEIHRVLPRDNLDHFGDKVKQMSQIMRNLTLVRNKMTPSIRHFQSDQINEPRCEKTGLRGFRSGLT